MPVSPDTGSSFAAPAAELLSAYEMDLLESGAKALRGDQSAAQWGLTATRAITRWRRQADAGVPGAVRKLEEALRVALAGAAEAGATTALADLPGLLSVAPAGVRGVSLSVALLSARLAHAMQQAPRLLETVLREAVAAGVAEAQAGRVTRRQASQQVLDRLVRHGVTGFRDSAGRNWSLSSYTEMAVRTELQATALAAGEARIKDAGLDLIMVSDSPRECPLCRPYEGQVLSLTGPPGEPPHTVTVNSELTGDPVKVRVLTSLVTARAAGFQHPNCTHAFSGYVPGVSKPTGGHANPDGYEEKQHQRYLERKVREWKRAQAVALDPVAQKQAAAKVREWQSQLREYVKEHDLKRQPGRESITRAV